MTRHERKEIRNQKLASLKLLDEHIEKVKAQREQQVADARRQYAAQHPVSAGVVPLVEYRPPGVYRRTV